ncbi:MAG: DUF309 domain-containing protein, partial [Anaerolineaceae bacterium]|nr:DUF309 domain-containing protein [Anaerolineaceae bacterium]
FNQEALKGLQAFNRQAFYDAHEYFEDAWRSSPLEEREIYRALLQISGGFYRLTQDRPAAALKFFDRAQQWLSPFPSPFKNLNVDDLRSWLADLLIALNDRVSSGEIISQHYHPIDLLNQESL